MVQGMVMGMVHRIAWKYFNNGLRRAGFSLKPIIMGYLGLGSAAVIPV
jgi:hypothetical protein